jgi:putative nucleotidyltransferase-like protein
MDGPELERGAEESRSRELLDTAQNLVVDLATKEVVAALCARGIRSILLKGPSFAAWLYRDGGPRPYTDIDLLIAREDVPAAHGVLAELGFQHPSDSWPHFLHRGPDQVDLHCSIKGVAVEEGRVWEVFSTMTEPQEVAGLELEILSTPARALHVALHAAQHGPDWLTQMDDLRRALDMLPFETWEAAAGLAEQLAATPAFATGLRLLPAGEAVANRLELSSRASVQTILRAKSPPDLALGFEELRGIQGLRAKFRFVARKLFPSRSYMRAMVPLARKGPIGLAIAYCRRLAWLSRRAVPGFRAWRQSRREADRACRDA